MAAGIASVLLRSSTCVRINQNFCNSFRNQIRCNTAPGMPTTLSRLDASQYAPLVDSYSSKGFDVRGTRFVGSLALLPRALFHWKVRSAADLTPECFTLFCLAEPQLELLVIGTGSRLCRVSDDVKKFLSQYNIKVEEQDTPNACATFNYLISEGRVTGAALIPPESLS